MLERHPAAACAALRGIEVSVVREAQKLHLVFKFEGEIDRVRIPAPRAPRVAERLWQHTCCEVFVARAGASAYREFNLSPSGEWAAYAFSRYREGALDPAALAPQIAVRRDSRELTLAAAVAIPDREKLLVGLAAVVEELDGGLSYWALGHAPGKPDFHHPHAFALELDEVRH